jgi:cytosine/adenosine deaminase-related metal-dependent hydrolase
LTFGIAIRYRRWGHHPEGSSVPRTLITNARILSLHPGAALLHSATLVLDDGIVADLLPEPVVRDAHAEYIDAGDALVLPGLVNAHTHAYSALVRGMPAPIVAADFAELLRNLWWKLDLNLSLEDVGASAMLTALDGLRCGVTAVMDHHASYGAVAGSLESVAAGFEAAGQRAVVCYEVSDRLGPEAAAAALAENARHAPDARQAPFRLGSMLGLHASFTLSDDTLTRAAALAREHDLRMHIHAAEDRIDRTGEAGAVGDSGVVERLGRFDLLQPGALVAHGVRPRGPVACRGPGGTGHRRLRRRRAPGSTRRDAGAAPGTARRGRSARGRVTLAREPTPGGPVVAGCGTVDARESR